MAELNKIFVDHNVIVLHGSGPWCEDYHFISFIITSWYHIIVNYGLYFRLVDGYDKGSIIKSAEMASTSNNGGGGGGGGDLLTSFITSVRADLDSPVTSNFGSRVGEYSAQVNLTRKLISGVG